MATPYQYLVLHQSCRNHPGVAAVQAAHAAGESAFDGPVRGDTHVVALVADKSDDLEALAGRLAGAGLRYVLIREPDEPYNGAAVALGIEPTEDRDRVRPHVASFKVFR